MPIRLAPGFHELLLGSKKLRLWWKSNVLTGKRRENEEIKGEKEREGEKEGEKN